MPAPPATIKAPVVDEELTVEFVKARFPIVAEFCTNKFPDIPTVTFEGFIFNPVAAYNGKLPLVLDTHVG